MSHYSAKNIKVSVLLNMIVFKGTISYRGDNFGGGGDAERADAHPTCFWAGIPVFAYSPQLTDLSETLCREKCL